MARKKLKSKRMTMGYTQEHTAQLANIHRGFYANIENGKKNCSVDVWLKILDALDIPKTDLFDYITDGKKGA